MPSYPYTDVDPNGFSSLEPRLRIMGWDAGLPRMPRISDHCHSRQTQPQDQECEQTCLAVRQDIPTLEMHDKRAPQVSGHHVSTTTLQSNDVPPPHTA